MERPGKRVLLIGWDAADWTVIKPLLEQGKMPALERFLARGSHGNIATLHPVLSPMLWTSIATGKRPFKHGILGFTEPTPDGARVRPVTNLGRKTKAVWNILNQNGKRSIVVGWWPSSPAEPIDGVMVSNHFQRAPAARIRDEKQVVNWPMPAGTVHPERLAEPLEEFRFHPTELTGDHLAAFLPCLADMDLDDERIVMLAKTLAETISIQGAATSLMQLEPWDFAAVYFDGIDHFCHGFMKYHPPRRPWIPEKDFEQFGGVVEAAYRFHDMMLGTLLELAGPDTNVVLMSDHGFCSDHLRPRRLPAEPAGPAAEHRDFGILAMAGPDIARGETIYGASLLDVCPTILSLFGLPAGLDMDGKTLTTALREPAAADAIPSWDAVDGADGRHPEETRVDPAGEAETLRQLVDLGYIEPVAEDGQTAARESVRELQYNLAQSYMDARLHGQAATILEALWKEWPREHRFATQLISCCGAMGETDRRREVIESLAELAGEHAREALEGLKSLRPEIDKHLEEDKTGRTLPRELQARVRKLEALASPKDALLHWLRASQAIAEGRPERAVPLLERLAAIDAENPTFHNHVAWANLRLRRFDEAAAAFRRALQLDPDNADGWLGLGQAMTGLHKWDDVIDAALRATELVYCNPKAHVVLGRALIRTGEFDHAEKALHVALAQAPRFPSAHRALAALYTRHLHRPEAARRHRDSARRARVDASLDRVQQRATQNPARTNPAEVPPPFEADPGEVITVVSGLPRSGTSMMMQMLEAGGIPACTDDRRQPDESNPRGYLEHEGAMRLATDNAWLAQARGRAVKVIAPLLKALPADRHYNVVFMLRDLDEVIQSQTAMLERRGRSGAALTNEQLRARYEEEISAARVLVDNNPNMRAVFVDYAEVTASPRAVAARLASFVGNLSADRAAEAVDPALRHHFTPQAPLASPAAQSQSPSS